MKANKIQKIEIRNIWGKYNFRWENLNPDVNILTGINGSGKPRSSTLLMPCFLQTSNV